MTNESREVWFYRLLVAAASIGVLCSLLWLNKYPLVWSDETDFVLPAWNFVRNGHFAYSITSGLYGMEITNTLLGRVPLFLASAVFYFLSEPSVYPIRFIHFLCGLVSVFVFYKIAAQLFSKKVALIGSSLLAVSSNIFWNYRDGRPEIVMLMLLLISLWLLIRDKFFLSGLVASLCFDVHLSNGILALLLLFVSSILLGKRRWLPMCAGISVGILYWVIAHLVVPGLDLFLAQYHGYYGTGRGPGQLFNSVAREWHRYYEFFWSYRYHRNMVLVPFILIALVHGFRDTSRNARLILSWTLVIIVFLACFVPNKTGTYMAYLFPFWTLLFADWVQKQIEANKWIPAATLTFLLVGFYGAQNAAYMKSFPTESFSEYKAQIKPEIPEGASVMGTAIHWWMFYNQPFLGEEFLMVWSRRRSEDSAVRERWGETLPEMFSKTGTDYLLWTGTLEEIANRSLWIQKTEWDAFRSTYLEPVKTIENPYYERFLGTTVGGPPYTTTIYRVNQQALRNEKTNNS